MKQLRRQVLSLFLMTFILKGSAQTPNLVIVTIDGFRWQEVFMGADSALISNPKFTRDTAVEKALYWDENPETRRKKLLPFFWSVLHSRGIILGNRHYKNQVDVANPYHLSYAGYNEMFSGIADWRIYSNARRVNHNPHIFEELHSMDAYRGQVALFSSWHLFPYILNKQQNSFFINSGYEAMSDSALLPIDTVQQMVGKGAAVRHDWLTWIAARDYLEKNRPRVLYIALGETDEWAHRKRYDQYLHHANAFDRMLAELWSLLQGNPFYKDNTVLMITTDHGRGSGDHNWHKHGMLVKGSSQTWLALISPGHHALKGEEKKPAQYYQYEIPSLVRSVLGIPQPISSTSTHAYAAGKSK